MVYPRRPVRRLILAALAGLAAVGPAMAETVLRRGNMAEPETLDPHRATGLPEAQIFYDLYEGLTVRGPDGMTKPGLAERWDVSPDGRVYVFHLRPDAVWSDGTPVTAQDVVSSMRRVVDPAATQARNANYLWPVHNAKAISDGRIKDPAQLGIRALDAHRVEISLDHPAPYLVRVLSWPMLAVLPAEKLQREGEAFFSPGRLVSAGPYRLAEHVPQDHVKLVRNERHRDAAHAVIDAVYFYPTENQSTELKRYRAGELDVTYTLPPDQIPEMRKELPAHLRISPQLGTYYYAPNLTREPWASKPGLRQALSMVIDRPMLERLTNGGEPPATAYVPPHVAAYTPQRPVWADWPMERRITEARRLLADAGYPGGRGLEVELLFDTSNLHRRIAVGLASLWQQALGVRTRMVNQEWKAFLNTRRIKNFPGLSRQGYIGAYDDANVFLEWFRSDIGPENPAGYADPAFDRLLDEAALQTDAGHRRDLLQRAERMLVDTAVVIPLFTYTSARLVNPRLTGWIDNPMDVHPTLYLAPSEGTVEAGERSPNH